MPRGLVDVQIDRHHEIEFPERAIETLGVGCRADRISRDREERANSFITRGIDFFRKCRHRKLTEKFGEFPNTTPPTSIGEVPCLAGTARHRLVGRLRKHRAARAVEVPAENVDDIHQPTRQRAKFLGTGPDPAVANRRRGSRETARELANVFGPDSRPFRNRLRRKFRRQGTKPHPLPG